MTKLTLLFGTCLRAMVVSVLYKKSSYLVVQHSPIKTHAI